jgi:hypothetical protein
LGDNARLPAPMNADDQTNAQPPAASHRRLQVIVRRTALRVLRPYMRHRTETVATLARLEADLEHVRERHTEQIERLEDLVRELVLSAEALRRAVASREEDRES